MNIKIQNCVFLCLIAFLASCSAPKEVLYLQDIASIKEENIDKNYEVIIHKDDLLAILVNSKDPELALPFNMPVVTYQIGAQTTAQQRLLGYLVDQNGDIDFPILGKIHVEGLTRMQVTELIKQKLMSEDLIKDPIVTVQFLNFKVSVMGEVTRPGTFDISGDRITLLQSPCYYLQQNDIVYVEPNKAKTGQSRINSNNSVGVWLSAVSVLASITSLMVTMFK